MSFRQYIFGSSFITEICIKTHLDKHPGLPMVQARLYGKIMAIEPHQVLFQNGGPVSAP